MKLLFCADIHIKLGAKNIPVDWAKNRYNLLWQKLRKLSEEVDAVIIGGDIFDKTPSLEELEVFFSFVVSCNKPTVIYSGNHEAVKKDTTFLSYLKDTVGTINSQVTIVDEYVQDYYPGVDILPYNCLKAFEKNPSASAKSNILCTHVRGEIPPHVKPEVDLELFKPWSMVLAGDLHSYENSQLNILYPGSPVTTSFHREKTDNGVLIVDTESLEHEFIKLDLPLLLKKSIKARDSIVPTDYHHTIYEVEGDLGQLATLQDNDLISKKISKKAIDTSLILEKDMTLDQELSEYLLYILEIDEDTKHEVVKMFKGHFTK